MSRSEAALRELKRLERKELRHARQRALIVAAARRVLETTGLATLTIDEVAQLAGVGKPSVFYYFASKQDLVGAVVVELIREETAQLVDAVNAAPGAVDALVIVVQTLVRLYRDKLMTFRAHYLAPQLYGITREHLEGMAPHTRAFFATCEAKIRADQQSGRLASTSKPGDLVSLAWTLGVGILFRASLLEPAGVRTDHAIDDLEREACAMLRAAFSRSPARRSRPAAG